MTNRWLLVGGLFLAACGEQRAPVDVEIDAGAAKASSPIADDMRARFVSVDDRGMRFQLVPPPTATGFDVRGGRLVPKLDRTGAAPTLVADVELPARADGAFRVAHGSAAIEVRIAGAAPVPAAISGGDAIYDGVLEDAALVHVPNVAGTEEFVRFSKRPAARELRYELRLEGAAGLRLYDGTFEVLDARGVPQLHTRAPWVKDANGVLRQGELRVEGCAFDSDDSAPWGRPVTPPGSDHCSVITTWDDEGMTYPVLVDPAWTSAGDLAQKRHKHAAAAIKTTSGTCSSAAGCVLVAGGRFEASTILSSAELYESGVWTTVAAMPNAREGHTLTATDDGRAVLVGGRNGALYYATTYTYNPNAATKWQSLGSLASAIGRAYGAATFQKVIGSGKIYRYLVFSGGYASGGAPVKTVDYYPFDATTPAWATAVDMLIARAEHVATSFSDLFCTGVGCIPPWHHLVAGGQTNAETSAPIVTSSVEDMRSLGIVSKIGDLSAGKKNLAVARADVHFLFAGGTNNGSTPMSHVDAVSMAASPTVTKGVATLPARFDLAAASFDAGGVTRAMFTGGSSGTSYAAVGAHDADIFYPATASTFTSKSVNMLNRHANHQATTLANNTVLVTGGNYGLCGGIAVCSTYYYATSELYKPLANGTACTTGAECASFECVDGYCCDGACGGQCEACNVAGKLGTCSAKTGVPVGARPACAAYGTTCGSSCDGVTRTACTYAGPSTVCSPAACNPVKNEQSLAATCNGSGACNLPVKGSCNPYACGATACKTSCATNGDCAIGFKCSGTGCVPSGDKGATCTVDTDCLSPNKCVDGVCCSSASCPTGQKCNIPGSVGECRLPYGAACTPATAASCPTGKCADGVCCDAVCAGQCEACNVAGSVGTCIAVSGPPKGTRTACVGTGACQAQCNGSDRTKCGSPPGVATVCAAATCSASKETPTRYCDGLGTCAPTTTTPCAPYICGAAACKTGCTADTDCQSGYFCDTTSGSCITTGALGTVCSSPSQCASGKCADGVCCTTDTCPADQVCNANGAGTCSKPVATTCTTAAECGSGNCVDGVCCNTLCDKQCEACDVAGSVGTCIAVVGKPHSSRAECAGTGACKATCDGSDRTKCGIPPGTSTTCAAPSCDAGIATATAYCDGAGNCGTPSKKACAPYTCDATDCKTVCTAVADCAAGYTCKDNACVPKAGVACATADDCKSGFCVDGVCCDSACTGQCEACDVGGSEGKCSPITGIPHGSRAKCFDGAGDACKALSCDGTKDRLKCVAYAAGPESTCGPTTCVDATTYVEAPRCDGSGSCKAGSTVHTCSPYACVEGACKASCTAGSDCASGFLCNGGKCEPAPTAKCSDDETASIPSDKSKAERPCAPYRCNSSTGDCFGACTSSDQCASDSACNAGACVPATPTGDTGDSGGCIASPRQVSGGGAMLGLFVAALGLLARRRR